MYVTYVCNLHDYNIQHDIGVINIMYLRVQCSRIIELQIAALPAWPDHKMRETSIKNTLLYIFNIILLRHLNDITNENAKTYTICI